MGAKFALLLAAEMGMLVAGCGGKVVFDGKRAGGDDSGSGGAPVASSSTLGSGGAPLASSSSNGSSTGTDGASIASSSATSSSSGDGGAACNSALISLQYDDKMQPLTSSCSDSWAQMHGATGADGFVEFVEGPATLVVEGCRGPTPTDFPVFLLQLWTPPQNLGSTKAWSAHLALSDSDIFEATGDDVTTIISQMDPPGGVIAGTFSARLVSSMTGAVKNVGGSFTVCHIQDSKLGPY